MEIAQIQKEVHENAKVKGFWDNNPQISEKLLLIISEISEAAEADRKDYFFDKDNKSSIADANDDEFQEYFEDLCKNTFEDELADAAIRIFDLAEKKSIDLEWHIEQKHKYNTMRPYKHGKKY